MTLIKNYYIYLFILKCLKMFFLCLAGFGKYDLFFLMALN